MVYERVLRAQLTLWSIQHNYFLYKPADPMDLNHDCIHIVNLRTLQVHLVKDWIKDKSFEFMYFNAQNCLLVANHNVIKVAKIPPLEASLEVSEVFEPDKT